MFEKRVRPLVVVCVALAALCVVSATLAIYFGVRLAKERDNGNGDGVGVGGDSDGELPPSPSVEGAYWEGAVAANGLQCSRVGTDILKHGGSAVEAAVATLLCDGVANPQSMGIGGGFLMLIYNRTTGTVEALNAREVAPLAARKDMYNGNATLMQKGGKSVAVPGELKGYQRALEKYKSNNLSWKDLLEPTIQLCKDGVPVTAYVAHAIRNVEPHLKDNPSLSEILAPNGKLLQEGDLMKRPKLAETLQILADSGSADVFYKGELGDVFVKDVQDFEGIITKEDLEKYEVKWSDSVEANLSNGYQMHTVPLPGSGPLLAFMLNILDGYVPAADKETTWQRIVEAFKFAYGRRTELGDPDYAEGMDELVKNLTSREYALNIRKSILDDRTFFDPAHYGAVVIQPDNHGTAHVSVVAPNGDAVSVTSTINLLFGAKIRSPNTGIILNDEMDDFSAPNITNAYGVPPSPANFIEPGKRPLSSMCPTIITDSKGDVRLVTGAAGGTKITSATALSIINNLWLGMSIKESVDARRLHHQIFPMNIQYEEGFSQEMIKKLEGFGHTTEEYATGSSFVAAVAVNQSAPYQKIFANSDFRRLGAVAGF